MATVNDFELGKRYTFNTYAPSLLGNFISVTAVAVVPYSIAVQYIDPAARHASVYNSLPEGEVANDYRSYYYLVVKHPDSENHTALGLPWIDESTIEFIDHTNIRQYILDAGQDDVSHIRAVLEANGYTLGETEVY